MYSLQSFSLIWIVTWYFSGASRATKTHADVSSLERKVSISTFFLKKRFGAALWRTLTSQISNIVFYQYHTGQLYSAGTTIDMVKRRRNGRETRQMIQVLQIDNYDCVTGYRHWSIYGFCWELLSWERVERDQRDFLSQNFPALSFGAKFCFLRFCCLSFVSPARLLPPWGVSPWRWGGPPSL